MEDVININVGITAWIIFWTTYWIFGSLITWKGHVDKIREVDMLKEVCSVLVVNMMWSFIGVLLLCFIPLRAMTDSHIIVKLIGVYLITDIWFYHVHIMLHQPHLYKNLHKLHHKFQKPYALTGLYSTGYEMIVANVFSAGSGPIIFQLPPLYIYIWFFLAALNTLLSHSGYQISFLIDGSHDMHHSIHSQNFGISPWLDMMYGTYCNPFQNSEEQDNLKID